MNDTDDRDRESAAPQPMPGSQPTAYRLVVHVIRGHRYLVGNITVHPVDEVPAGVGTRFASTGAVEWCVRRALAGLFWYHAVELVADGGHVLMRGVRGTGNTWIWRDTHPGGTSAPD